jgi:hypothetical protein
LACFPYALTSSLSSYKRDHHKNPVSRCRGYVFCSGFYVCFRRCCCCSSSCCCLRWFWCREIHLPVFLLLNLWTLFLQSSLVFFLFITGLEFLASLLDAHIFAITFYRLGVFFFFPWDR